MSGFGRKSSTCEQIQATPAVVDPWANGRGLSCQQRNRTEWPLHGNEQKKLDLTIVGSGRWRR